MDFPQILIGNIKVLTQKREKLAYETKCPQIIDILGGRDVTVEGKNCRASAAWAPRELNAEADDLANGRVGAFDPALRQEVDLAKVDWLVLPPLLAAGQELLELRRAARGAQRGRRRRRAADRPKAVDPW